MSKWETERSKWLGVCVSATSMMFKTLRSPPPKNLFWGERGGGTDAILKGANLRYFNARERECVY